jgi:hypothetical protein
MSGIVHCPHCRQPLDVTHAAALAVVECPSCRGALQIPATPPAAPEFTASSNRPAPSRRRRKQRSLAPLLIFLVAVSMATGFGAVVALREQPAAVADRSSPPREELEPEIPSLPESIAASDADAVSAEHPQEEVPPALLEAADPLEEHASLPATQSPAEPPEELPVTATAPPPAPQPAFSGSQTASGDAQTAPSGEPAEDVGRPGDYPSVEDQRPDLESMSPQERARWILENRVRKVVERHFQRQRRERNRYERVDLDDYFIVANYEMPLATRIADLRFDVAQGVAPSVEEVSDYLLSTPSTSVRDFQVVARFATREEAEAGIAVVRQRYDAAKQYQAQLLA